MSAMRVRRESPDPPNSRLSEILLKAAELFDQSGYANASMEDIARAVGLAKPTLYHYVRSKDEILYLIHREFMTVAFEAMNAPERQGLDAAEQLRRVVVDILTLMDTHRPLVRVFFEHFRDLPRKHQQSVIQQRDRYSRWVADAVRRGIRTGEFRRVDPKLVALAMFGMSNWAYQWYRREGRLSAEEIGETFAAILLVGISGPSQVRLRARPRKRRS